MSFNGMSFTASSGALQEFELKEFELKKKFECLVCCEQTSMHEYPGIDPDCPICLKCTLNGQEELKRARLQAKNVRAESKPVHCKCNYAARQADFPVCAECMPNLVNSKPIERACVYCSCHVLVAGPDECPLCPSCRPALLTTWDQVRKETSKQQPSKLQCVSCTSDVQPGDDVNPDCPMCPSCEQETIDKWLSIRPKEKSASSTPRPKSHHCVICKADVDQAEGGTPSGLILCKNCIATSHSASANLKSQSTSATVYPPRQGSIAGPVPFGGLSRPPPAKPAQMS
jgi:hypothetical protein